MNECEQSKTESYRMSRKYEELLTQLSEFLDTDIKEKEKPQEHLMSKVIMYRQEFLSYIWTRFIKTFYCVLGIYTGVTKLA